MNHAILLVEDHADIMEVNKNALQAAGYSTLTAATLDEARSILERSDPGMIVLDIVMPDGSGLDFCKEIRDKIHIPILFLTIQSESGQIINGLTMGADDYMTKPYEPQELVARVKARLREYDRLRLTFTENIKIGDLEVDMTTRRVLYHRHDLLLTPKEFALLAELIRQPKCFVGAYELYHGIWGMQALEDVRTIFVHISKLRRKLKEAGVEHIWIERDFERGIRLLVHDPDTGDGDAW